MPGDLARRADAEAIVAAILGRHARLDAVVGAAGVNVTPRMWSELSAADMDYLLDGNLRSQMYTVAAALPGAPLAVLSGPGFARDLAAGLPTAVVLAAPEMERARRLAATLATPRLRVYASDDPVGVQVGGALKNVVAIACGVVMGRGLGESASAAPLPSSTPSA